MEKPGWQTSEFWLTLAAQVIPVLVLLGVLTPDQSSGVNDAVANVIKDAFALLASVIPVAVYVWGRAKVKSGK